MLEKQEKKQTPIMDGKYKTGCHNISYFLQQAISSLFHPVAILSPLNFQRSLPIEHEVRRKLPLKLSMHSPLSRDRYWFYGAELTQISSGSAEMD